MNVKVVCGSQEWKLPRKTKGEASQTEGETFWRLASGTIWNIPDAERPVCNFCTPWESYWLFQGLQIAETPFLPKAIVCPWVWLLSPKMVATVPAQGLSRILLKLWQAGPTPSTMRWPLGHSLAWNFSFTLAVFFYLKISLGAENPMLGLFTFERSYSFTDSVLSDSFSSKCCEMVKSCAPESYIMIYTATLHLNCSMMFYMCKKSNTHLVA